MVHETIEYHFLIIASSWILDTDQTLGDRLKFVRMLHTFDSQLPTTGWWTLAWIWAADGAGAGSGCVNNVSNVVHHRRGDGDLLLFIIVRTRRPERSFNCNVLIRRWSGSLYVVLLPSSKLSLCLMSARPRPHCALSAPLPRPWPTPGTRREP